MEEEQIVLRQRNICRSSAYEIICLTEGRKYSELSVEDFRLATYEQTCQRCAFRAIFWEEPHVD